MTTHSVGEMSPVPGESADLMFPFWSGTCNSYGIRIHLAVDLAFPLLGRGPMILPSSAKALGTSLLPAALAVMAR